MASGDGIRVTARVDLHGLEEDLLRVGPKIAKRLFRRALKVIGELWKGEMQSRVPQDSGDLHDSIGYVIKTSPKDDSGVVIVGPTYDAKVLRDTSNRTENPGVYGLFVEFGLKQKKYKKTPFARPTYDSTADRAVELFAANLREDLEEAIKD